MNDYATANMIKSSVNYSPFRVRFLTKNFLEFPEIYLKRVDVPKND